MDSTTWPYGGGRAGRSGVLVVTVARMLHRTVGDRAGGERLFPGRTLPEMMPTSAPISPGNSGAAPGSP
jgi:hypothetical protein